MTYFVNKDSIVRKIWGRADTTLFIFAGSAAEFALNKAVDWLYFTGRLPADPLGRLFSTIVYSRQILFSEEQDAFKAIDKITAIHGGVEESRGKRIPDWAYRDVLFMLIDYTIRSFETLDRPLTTAEHAEIFDVFYRMGMRMQLSGLPQTFAAWQVMREEHLRDNLVCSHFTTDLFNQYRKHLGWLRYTLMLQVQAIMVPAHVKQLLSTKQRFWAVPGLSIYKFLRNIRFERPFRNLLLPSAYKAQILQLDTHR